MKKIGMIVAVEMDAVLSLYGKPAGVQPCGGFTVSTYENGAYVIYVVNSGVGEIAAAAAAEMLIVGFGVDLIVNFGVVGGLTEDMTMARTVVVERVVHTDFDTSAWNGYEPGRYPDHPDRCIGTDPGLVSKALEAAPELVPVTCASADKFVAGAEKKRALQETYGADICEMEAAGIVLTANRAGIPCLLIKAVSDGITGGAEEFEREVLRSSKICLSAADRIIRSL